MTGGMQISKDWGVLGETGVYQVLTSGTALFDKVDLLIESSERG